MKDPHHYLDTIQRNVEKMRAQGQVTPTENALFGMLDGLAGLTLQTMERLAVCEQRLRDWLSAWCSVSAPCEPCIVCSTESERLISPACSPY